MFERQNITLEAVVSVCIVRVEYELLIAVMVIIGNALSAPDDAPAHCIPFFERIADGRVRPLRHDLAGVMQIDVRILRDKPVKIL